MGPECDRNSFIFGWYSCAWTQAVALFAFACNCPCRQGGVISNAPHKFRHTHSHAQHNLLFSFYRKCPFPYLFTHSMAFEPFFSWVSHIIYLNMLSFGTQNARLSFCQKCVHFQLIIFTNNLLWTKKKCSNFFFHLVWCDFWSRIDMHPAVAIKGVVFSICWHSLTLIRSNIPT